jgi:hypothetical protein
LIDVLLVIVQMALQIALPGAVIRRDMKRLDAAALARSWNDASFWSAIVVFGALALPVHFVKSRRSIRGVLLGLFWFAATAAVVGAINWAALSIFE